MAAEKAPRRSRRIASQEPDDIEIVKTMAERVEAENAAHAEEVARLKELCSLKKQAADERIAAAIAASIQKQAAAATPPQKTTPPHSSPKPSSSTAEQRVSSDENAAVSSPVTSPSPLRLTTPAPKWLSYIPKVLGAISSPFSRKRGAESNENEAEEPTAKRVRREDPVTATSTPTSPPPAAEQTIPTVVVSSTPSRTLFSRQYATPSRPAVVFASKQHSNEPSTPSQPAGSSSTSPASNVAHTEPSRKRRAPSDEPEETVRHRSQYLGPSTTNPRVPTSLSVISERTERSQFTATPMSAPGTTPSRKPRSIRDVRAARESRQVTPHSRVYAWEQPARRPKETNADARFAKIQRMKELQKEMDELMQDKDVMEMSSHKRKKVKVDHLEVIPHNRPGDPSGMFRVPDIDSDDEIEVVDDSSSLRSNIFEEASKLQSSPLPAQGTPGFPALSPFPAASVIGAPSSGGLTSTPKGPYPTTSEIGLPSSGGLTPTPNGSISYAAQAPQITPTPAAAAEYVPNWAPLPENPVFNFPDVGRRDLNIDPYPTAEEEAAYLRRFVAGAASLGLTLELS